MKLFPYAHATHPQWRMAAALVLAQLRAHMALPGYASAPSLGLLYITDHYASHAQAILDHISAELPEVTDWSGTVGVGIAANNVEYFDEPALAVMLCDLSPDQYRVFSGVAPLPPGGSDASGFVAHTALLHADPAAHDLGELIAELADRTRSGYVFGGLVGSRTASVQFALSSAGHLRGQGAVGGVFTGGISGVAFGPDVELLSRVTQGAQPIHGEHTITAVDGNLVLELDREPALDVLLRELGVSLGQPQQAMERLRRTLVGLTLPQHRAVDIPLLAPARGQFGPEVMVRHIIGLDPARRGVAIAERPPVGRPTGVLRAACPGRAGGPCARVYRDSRGAGARSRRHGQQHGRRRGRTRARTAHHRCGVRELLGARRAALRCPERRTADRAQGAGRRAAGGFLRRRRDRAPAALRLHRRADGVHRRSIENASNSQLRIASTSV